LIVIICLNVLKADKEVKVYKSFLLHTHESKYCIT
jgi:hypothetical protein